MTNLILFILAFCLIQSAFASSSMTHQLSFFTNNTVPLKINAANGSKIFLSSRDSAIYLSNITLETNGTSITLDKLLSRVDDNGFTIGWPVNSDLTISTTNTVNITKSLHGELFIITPTMAQDPNFFVCVVQGNYTIKRTTNDNTTIVFLAVYNQKTDGIPVYAGFKHVRIENIVQPMNTSLLIYRDVPDDYYGDVTSSHTLQRNIFSNPLIYSLADQSQISFFEHIDPLQFSENLWLKGIGGFQLDVNEYYVDTTTIQAGAVTVTGMSNSQLFTYESSVNFIAGSNGMGSCGYVIATELYSNSNLTIQLNGTPSLKSVFVTNGSIALFGDLHEENWPAVSMQIFPGTVIIGQYYIQYFNVDNGPETSQSISTTAQTIVSTLAVQTTSNPCATPFVVVPLIITFLYILLNSE